MPDLGEQYLEGIGKLLSVLGPGHADYLAALTLQGRLAEIVREMRQYGSTAQTRAELAHVTTELNRLCIDNLEPGQSFNDLCGIAASTAPATPPGTVEHRFLSGAVLYANVLGFSTLPHVDQDVAVEFMDREIRRFLDAFGPRCWLDFRGGDFLLFLERKPDEWREDTLIKAFGLGLQLQLKTLGHSFKVGVTLHWEDDATWRYLGDRLHLMGSALNAAQLFMSFSDGGHFFLSTEAHRDLDQQMREAERASLGALLGAISDRFGDVWPDLHLIETTYENYRCHCEIFTFHDRHKREHNLYNLYAVGPHGQVCVGNESRPCYRVAVEYRDDRRARPDQVFIQRLVEADEVAIVGITHEGTATFLQEALEFRRAEGRDFWNQLQIVFPSRPVLKKLIDQRSDRDRLRNWEAGKRSVFEFLLSQNVDYLNRWECLEFDGNLPFVGNRFIRKDNEVVHESVRIAPTLPGGDMKSTYYIEFFRGMPAYDQVSNAFSLICTRSTGITEWDIYGRLEGGEFHYQGIVNRRRLNRRKKFCFPVVLIMLHADVETGHRSILQERTPYNGSSDIGTFSNISGRVTDMDVYVAKGLRPHVDFEYDYEDKRDVVATAEFNDVTGIAVGDPLPPGTWEAAAIREAQEELGLEIAPDQLVPHCTYHLKREDRNLLFRIFSLELRRTPVDQLQIIEDSRPHVDLEPFDLNRLRQYHQEGRFNRLLQNKFEEVFLPIFRELGIEEEW